MDKIRYRENEAEAIAASNSFNASLVAQDPKALSTFKTLTGSYSKYYVVALPTAREAEFNAATEEDKRRMALVGQRALINNGLTKLGFVAAYEDEYSKEFGA